MTKKRWTVEDEAKIVIESLTTTTSTANICRKYGLSPNPFYPWREEFLEGGRAALVWGPSARAAKALQKENATLKTLVGEIDLMGGSYHMMMSHFCKRSIGINTTMPASTFFFLTAVSSSSPFRM